MELDRIEVDLSNAKELYDELNAENLRKAADARNAALADSRTFAAKLKNAIKDTEKRITKATEEVQALEGEAQLAAQEALKALQTTLKDQQKAQSDEESKFANLNKADAKLRVETLGSEWDSREEIISQLQAELEYENRLIEQYSLEMTDANKPEADRAFAKE